MPSNPNLTSPRSQSHHHSRPASSEQFLQLLYLAKNYSNSELATLTSLSYSTVAGWRRKPWTSPRFTSLLLLAEGLGYTLVIKRKPN